MKEILKKDISVKILSLLLAILFWIFVLNVDNPYEYRELDVPVKVLNKDTLDEKGLYLKNEKDIPQTVKVKISGRKKVLDSITASDISVELDFSTVSSVEDKTLNISQPHFISPKRDVKISFAPQPVYIALERILGYSFPVTLERTGNPKQGYKVVSITYSPEAFPLQFQESILNTVDSIIAVIDLANSDRSFEKKIPCKVLNKSGKEVTAFKNLTIDVKVEIGKEVPVVPSIKGNPAVDHVEVQQSVSPATMVVLGDPAILGSIVDLKTETVNIENATQSINTTAKIKLPQGIKLANSSPDVAVNIIIEKLIQKEYTVLAGSIGVTPPADGLTYEIKSEKVSFILKGRSVDLENINELTLKPSVNLSDLSPGTHTIPLGINLPAQVKLIGEAKVEVKISQDQQ